MTKRRATIARRLVEAQHTAAMLTTFNEVDMSAVMAAARAPQGSLHQEVRRRRRHRVVLRQGGDRRAQGVPADQRRDPGRRDRLQALLRHRHGGRRRGRPGRAGDSRCRSHGLRRHRAGDSRLREARAGRHADARGSQGRHVHDHQRRRVRIADEHADPQPAAGRHPRPAQDRRSRRGRERPGGDPPDDVPRAQLRPPPRRRPRSGAVPRQDQGIHRRPGLDAARSPERCRVPSTRASSGS